MPALSGLSTCVIVKGTAFKWLSRALLDGRVEDAMADKCTEARCVTQAATMAAFEKGQAEVEAAKPAAASPLPTGRQVITHLGLLIP